MTKLELQDGQWIDVKDGLKVRDKRDQHTYSVDGVSSDGQTYRFNIVKHQIAQAAVRIVNWLIKDEFGKDVAWPSGKPFRDRVAVIESLDEATFDLIHEALSAHLTVRELEAVAEKKETTAGETGSAPSSPSAN